MSDRAQTLASITYLEFLKKFFGEIYIIALPAIAVTLNTSRTSVQYALPIFFVSVFLAQLFAGPSSDYLGRRHILILLLPLFVVGNLICALVHDTVFLYVGIGLAGLGIGAAPTIGKVIIFDAAQGNVSKATVFLVITSYVVAWSPAIGMAVGGNIAHFLNWRMIFFLSALLGFVALITTIFFTREIHHPASMKRLSIYFHQYFRLLLDLRLVLLFLAISALASGIIVFYTLIPFLLHSTLLIPLNRVGYVAFFIVASNILGKTMALVLVKKIKPGSIFLTAALISLAGALFMVVAAKMLPLHFVLIVIPMMIYVVGVGMIMPVVRPVILATHPKHIGASSSMTSVSIALFSALMSYIAAHMHIHTALPMALLIANLAVIAVLCLLLHYKL